MRTDCAGVPLRGVEIGGLTRAASHHPPLFDPVSPVNPPCPLLPAVTARHDCFLTRRHGAARGAAFYQDCLRCAQVLWSSGKPAQALLFLNKALAAELAADAEPLLSRQPPPYAALTWILMHAAGGGAGFLGNPVRHFQHLASRVSGPRAAIRSWRAWLCFHLACRVMPPAGFPRDGRQLAREGLWIPGLRQVMAVVAANGWPGEARAAHASFAMARDIVLPSACECAQLQSRKPV